MHVIFAFLHTQTIYTDVHRCHFCILIYIHKPYTQTYIDIIFAFLHTDLHMRHTVWFRIALKPTFVARLCEKAWRPSEGKGAALSVDITVQLTVCNQSNLYYVNTMNYNKLQINV